MITVMSKFIYRGFLICVYQSELMYKGSMRTFYFATTNNPFDRFKYHRQDTPEQAKNEAKNHINMIVIGKAKH